MSLAFADVPPRTLAEFLEWEQHQELRFEWDGVQPVAMTGGTFAHTELASRLYDLLRPALRGRCTVVRVDLQIRTERASRIRYPDLAVTCTPIAPTAREVPDPVLIVEVLSDSTSGTDRGVKRAEYAALPSLEAYLILSQERMLAAVYARETGFAETLFEGADAVLRLPPAATPVRLGELYEGLVAC